MKVKQSAEEEHTLFCPVYYLDAKLQGGVAGLPKWEPRSRLGMFIFHSPDHASDVALVLNLVISKKWLCRFELAMYLDERYMNLI